MKSPTWKTVVDGTRELRESTWRDALVEAEGNITHAAKALGIYLSLAGRLMKQFDLYEFAAELRLKHGGGARVRSGKRKGVVLGRPRKGV